jgi:amino acid transporter
MADLQPAPPETKETALHHGRLGVIGIVFFVVAAAAPLVGMTGAVPVAVVVGNGAAAPGAYVCIGLVLLLFSVGYGAMGRHVTNAGAFFAYVGRGMGIAPGVGSAFVSLVAYIAIQLAIFGFFGAVVGGTMNSTFGIDLPWYVWTLIAWVLVLVLSLASVDIGAKLLGVLMGLELLSLVVTFLAVLFHGGGPEGFDLAASFAPGNIFVGGLAGASGIAFAFAFASYIGFEATAIYGEEAKDPHRTVPLATYVAVGTITVIFAVTSWAMVSGLGPSVVVDRMVEISSVDGVPLADPAAILFAVATEYVGPWLATVMSWLVISSLFAGLLAFQNSCARYFYAMGRAGVLPRRLDHVNKSGAPALASVTTSVITLLIIVWFIIKELDPVLNMFFWFSGMTVVAIVWVEILVCLSVVIYFRKTRLDTRVWNTVIAPLAAAVLLGLGEYLLTSRFGLLAGTVAEGVDPSQQAWGLNLTGWILISAPFVLFVFGTLWGSIRQDRENVDAVADLVG